MTFYYYDANPVNYRWKLERGGLRSPMQREMRELKCYKPILRQKNVGKEIAKNLETPMLLQRLSNRPFAKLGLDVMQSNLR